MSYSTKKLIGNVLLNIIIFDESINWQIKIENYIVKNVESRNALITSKYFIKYFISWQMLINSNF